MPEHIPDLITENVSNTTIREYLPRSRPFMQVDNAALQHNFKFLSGLAGLPGTKPEQSRIMAVVKAEAYGHGMVGSAAALLKVGARDFGVGSVLEGAELREAMPLYASDGEYIRIVSLLGQHGPDEAELCLKYRITPFVGSLEELKILREAVRNFCAARNGRDTSGTTQAPFPIILKLNTGMSRLGFNPSDAAELAEYLKNQDELVPVALASHLARADEPEDSSLGKTRQQAGLFLTALNIFRTNWPAIMASLCNSAGLLQLGQILEGLDCPVPQLHRPGLALYGLNPFYGMKQAELGHPLRPVMSVLAPVLAVQDLEPGAEISYGGTFVAPHKMRVAVLAVGYADGLNRGISRFNFSLPAKTTFSTESKKFAGFILNGHKVPLLGRICMQMCMVDVSALPTNCAAKPGDLVYIVGGEKNCGIRAEELAAWADTIAYEIVCAFGGHLKI